MNALEEFKWECTTFFSKHNNGSQMSLVFGEGMVDNPVVMLIGEAPGEQEVLQGRPFVGKAGKNLDGFLQALSLKREELYITNAVKMRPSKISAAGRVVNRPPTREERALFASWLMREIALIRPQVLVTLGNVALQAFVSDTIGNRHGRWSAAMVSPPQQPVFCLPLFALYHPAAIIYNASLKETYQADLIKLSQALAAHSYDMADI